MNTQKRTALFPGSFDPFTKGHEAIVLKALKVFDEVVIGIGFNSSKSGYFDLNKRIEHIQTIFEGNSNIKVVTYSTLTVDLAKKHHINHIIRGLRDGKDFDYEKSIAMMNSDLDENVDTVFFLTDKEYSAINSTIVREIHKNNGDISKFVSKVHLL